jgi:hypothetical protein
MVVDMERWTEIEQLIADIQLLDKFFELFLERADEKTVKLFKECAAEAQKRSTIRHNL